MKSLSGKISRKDPTKRSVRLAARQTKMLADARAAGIVFDSSERDQKVPYRNTLQVVCVGRSRR